MIFRTKKKELRLEVERSAEKTARATEVMLLELEQARRRLDSVLEKLQRRAEEGRPLLRLVDRP